MSFFFTHIYNLLTATGERSQYSRLTRLRAERSGVRRRQRQDFQNVRTGCGGPPSPLINGYQGLFPQGKWLWCQVGHSPPISSEVKNECSYTSTPPVFLRARTVTTLPSLTARVYIYVDSKIMPACRISSTQQNVKYIQSKTIYRPPLLTT
jgi:hypothetical protein